MSLTDSQIERYSRHILLPQIGGLGQQRLLSASVRIRGDGPAAEASALYLAAAGVGTLFVDQPLLDRCGQHLRGMSPETVLTAATAPSSTLGIDPAGPRRVGAMAAMGVIAVICETAHYSEWIHDQGAFRWAN